MNLQLPSLLPCYMFCRLNWPLSSKMVTFSNISPEHCKTSLQVLKKGSLYYVEGFSDGSVVKTNKQTNKQTLPASAGDVRSIPSLGRSPGEGNSNPFWFSCLVNPTDRGAWQTTVQRSWTQLKRFSNNNIICKWYKQYVVFRALLHDILLPIEQGSPTSGI